MILPRRGAERGHVPLTKTTQQEPVLLSETSTPYDSYMLLAELGVRMRTADAEFFQL